MLSHEHKRPATDRVEPDLPITPMLDMSFQLLAFFLITFKPTATEVQFKLSLPRESGPVSEIPPVRADTPTAQVILRVTAAGNGTIERVTLSEEGSALVPKDLGASVERVRDELTAITKRLAQTHQVGRLTLELDGHLLQDYVVQLTDTGVRAGFTDLSPVPIDPRKR
jgi:biopolymer transport protein ExbD